MKMCACGVETSNPKYCSRSCAAKHNNNSSKPRRVRTKKCLSCDTLILASRTYCKACWDSQVLTTTSETTLEEFWNRPSCKGKHPSWKSAQIRGIARMWYKNEPKVCERPGCDYNLHVECCHIHPVSKFPPSAKVREVNDRENILILCRNCHWELDHGVWGDFGSPDWTRTSILHLLCAV